MTIFSNKNLFKLYTMIWAFLYLNLFSLFIFALGLASFLTLYFNGDIGLKVLTSLELSASSLSLTLLLVYYLSYFFSKKKEKVVRVVPYLQLTLYILLFLYFVFRLITYYLSPSLFWGDFNLYLCLLGIAVFSSQAVYAFFKINLRKVQHNAGEELKTQFQNIFKEENSSTSVKKEISEQKRDIKSQFKEKETIIDGDFTEIKKDD